MSLHLFGQVRRSADNLAGLLGSRLDLFGLELEEELDRRLCQVSILLVLVVFAAFALLFATVAGLVLAARNDCLLAATFGVALLYGVLAVVCGVWLRRLVLTAPQPFATTRAEFGRDQDAMQSRTEEST